MSTGELDPLVSPEPWRMTRGNFIRGAAGAGIALGAVGLVRWHEDSVGRRAVQRSDFEQGQMALFDKNVKTGMSDQWLEAVVWPGLAIIPSDVELYGTATFMEDSRLEWPKQESADHLAVQRPFLVNRSAGLDPGPIIHNPKVGDAEVLGFWMPGSQEIAFCNRSRYQEEILMPTNSQAAIYQSGYRGIVGERVSLEFSVHRDGLTWRYLVNHDTEQFTGKHYNVTKVVGRSVWADSGSVANAYTSFETGEGDDLVQLPEAK